MTQTRGTRVNLLAIAMGALFLAVGALIVVGTWGAFWTDTAIVRSGEQAQGRVTWKDYIFASDGDSDYVLEYTFDLPGGERVEARHSVSENLWASLEEGDALVVRYAARDPGRNFPDGEGVTSGGIAIFATILGTALGLFGLLLLANSLKRPAGEP